MQSSLASGDANSKIELLVEETNQLWNFVQSYVDEQTWTPIKVIRSPHHEIEDKMNAIEWLSRTASWLSPESIAKTVNAFKELYNNPDPNKRNEFVKCRHNS